jgi:hypothetical protein
MSLNVKDESQSSLGKMTFVKQESDVNGDGDDGNGTAADDDLEDDFLFRDSYIEDRDLGMEAAKFISNKKRRGFKFTIYI